MSLPSAANRLNKSSRENLTAATHTSTLTEHVEGKIQVFLGGSCNPTTWRQTIAIPYLKLNGISYYNPQIDDWTPEVVNVERYAKENADCLLFVIDKQTRSTVSLVESAFMAGAGRRLVLVIYPFDYSIDHLSIQSDTKQTSNVVETLEETTTTSTTRHTASSVQLQSTSSSKTSTSSKSMTTSSSNFASGTIRVNGESISIGEFQELRQARYILQSLLLSQEIPIFSDIPQALSYVTESLTKGLESDRKVPSASPDCNELKSSGEDVSTANSDTPLNALKDVYLSLDDNDGDSSLESTVIPILQEKGLTFEYKPMSCITRYSNVCNKTPINNSSSVNNKTTNASREVSLAMNELSASTKYSPEDNEQRIVQNSRLAIEKELSAIRSSRAILFVITNKCRGLSIMVLASHFMAMFRRNVVLCIQYLEEPCCINGEVLSKSAIADYNRGRVYLGDYAVETQVPVFGTIREAVDCCSEKCGYNNKSTIK